MLQIWFALHTLLWSTGIEIGGSVLSLNVLLLIPVGILWLLRRRKITKITFIATAVFVIILLFSFAVSRVGPCEDKFSKAIITAPLLTLLLIIGLEIGAKATPKDWLKLRTTAFWTIVTAFIFIVAEMLFPQFFSPNKSMYHPEYKYSGIFNEPSHVAISLFPCIAILLSSTDRSFNRKGIFALLLLFIVSRSSTLVMLTFCYIAYRLVILGKLRQSLKYLSILALVIAIATTMNYELLIAPTVARVVGVTSSTNENPSSLIYLKGWQDALANITRTSGLGLGFNMMGCSPLPDTPLRSFLSVQGRMDTNNEDGSFLLSKIMSEFGLIALVFFVWVVSYWVRYEIKSKAWSTYALGEVSAIHNALMFSFVATSLLRSAGYFQGGIILWATAATGAALWSKKQQLQHK